MIEGLIMLCSNCEKKIEIEESHTTIQNGRFIFCEECANEEIVVWDVGDSVIMSEIDLHGIIDFMKNMDENETLTIKRSELRRMDFYNLPEMDEEIFDVKKPDFNNWKGTNDEN
jgi:DNA-directed RNA polymerase subunit RPC12/RpoP